MAQPEPSPEPWLPDLYRFYERRSVNPDEDYEHPKIHKINLNNVNDNRPHTTVKIFDLSVNALLDCGSNLSFINAAVFKKLRNVRLRKPAYSVELQTADGSPLEILGEVLIPFTFNGKTRVLPTLVAPSLTKECICGMDYWHLFQIHLAIATISEADEETTSKHKNAGPNLSKAQLERLENIKKMFKVAYSDTLETTPLCEHHIVLKEECQTSKPVRLYPYPIAPKFSKVCLLKWIDYSPEE